MLALGIGAFLHPFCEIFSHSAQRIRGNLLDLRSYTRVQLSESTWFIYVNFRLQYPPQEMVTHRQIGRTRRPCKGSKPSSAVDMVKGAAVDSAEGAGCRCQVPLCRAFYVQQWMYSLSLISKYELGCSDPPISRCRRRGCSNGSCRRCRVPLRSTMCREPYVQQWILQRVQSASAECGRAECHACSEKSALSHLQPSTSNLEDSHFSHPTCAGLLLRFAVP